LSRRSSHGDDLQQGASCLLTALLDVDGPPDPFAELSAKKIEQIKRAYERSAAAGRQRLRTAFQALLQDRIDTLEATVEEAAELSSRAELENARARKVSPSGRRCRWSGGLRKKSRSHLPVSGGYLRLALVGDRHLSIDAQHVHPRAARPVTRVGRAGRN
jgi:O-phosphoseryl-tRNA(Cys) synthetase